ncbi:F0F1 ATP synthase subunit delta [Luteolibacter pohnpeiensis]|uniref:F0F1 ATP synthase subunit delta n=1 Tax=Luteolibacter pohnpeiensis TaxID=454153 RepID=A0A934SAN4_9BACT|nr:F0F1 ATP synthase subunit delta [Luteolibacter pohnpeiensis]MBK1881853.1 F0F1 ATP synthase subunit delta [Luteolibacter pohnpeiensis]
MKISKTAAAAARRLFGYCQSGGRLDQDKLRTVFSRISEEKPRDYRDILMALQRLARLDLERRKVTVESAVELDEPARQRLVADLEKKYGSDLEVEYLVKPALLGGLTIRVGYDVFDGSVQGRLDRLAKAF